MDMRSYYFWLHNVRLCYSLQNLKRGRHCIRTVLLLCSVAIPCIVPSDRSPSSKSTSSGRVLGNNYIILFHIIYYMSCYMTAGISCASLTSLGQFLQKIQLCLAFEDILTIFVNIQNKKLLLLGGKACLDTPSFTSLGSQICILTTAIVSLASSPIDRFFQGGHPWSPAKDAAQQEDQSSRG